MKKKAKQQSTIKKPSFYLYITEVIRAFKDFRQLSSFRKSFKNDFPADGHPVLLIPGFMSSDVSTLPLRRFIKKLGYVSYGWEMERNIGRVEKLDLLLIRIEKLHQKHGQKVTLIGWSLGGVYARQLAKAKPELVRQVITLGSPFSGLTEPNNASWLFPLLHDGKKVEELESPWLIDIPAPAPVPTTAIYTKEDGIVSWRVCMEQTVDEIHQNIQVTGSHIGLGVNATVWHIIADRLRYKKENWALFKKDPAMLESELTNIQTNGHPAEEDDQFRPEGPGVGLI